MSLARRFRPDLIELRLDFIRGLDIEKLEAIKGHLYGNEILTIRSKKEGGRLSVSDSERIKLIRHVIFQLRPSIIDIEISTIRRFPSLLQDLKKTDSKLVASFHDLQGTKTEEYLRKMVSFASYGLKSSMYAVKIVGKARKLEDNLKILNLYKSGFNKSSSKLVAFCFGKLGVPSRILSLYFGAPFGYVSLPEKEPVASGQLNIEVMRRLLEP
jgi:3-dehydroquinate dehydratase type I